MPTVTSFAMRRVYGLLVAVAAALGGLVSAGATLAAASPSQLTRLTVILPNPSAINVYPLFAAMGEGFMAEEGLEINVEAVDGSGPVLQALAAGRAQIGFAGPGPTLNARARGVDVVFFYNYYTRSLFGLQVLANSAYRTPADLKGKVIGVGTADGAEVSFTRAILSEYGMVEGRDYTFLPVGDGGTAAAALLRRDVEAYAASIIDAAIMSALGLTLREITPEKYLYRFGNGFVAMGPFIRQNPKVIEGFGRAITRGALWARQNKERALEHARRFNPQEAEDRSFVSALFDIVQARIEPVGGNQWGYQPPEGWEAWHQSLLSSGELDAPLPNLNAAYTNEFVPAFNRY